MSARVTLATTKRVLRQLRRDHRTVALLLVVPVLLLTLLRYVYDDRPEVFDHVGGPLLALFPFTTMFLVSSVAMLRERISGTLERLLTTPLGKLDLLLGYAGAFSLAALVQAALVLALSTSVLGLDVAGGWPTLAVVAELDALLGMSLGLFCSAFARTEFQAVQFLPAIVLPQVLICGLLAPRESMVAPLRWLSDVAPLTYAVDGASRLSRTGFDGRTGLDIAVIAVCVPVFLALGAATMRRRTD